MPSPHLSPAQKRRQDAGLCPCGCGRPAPTEESRGPVPRTYATTACRGRAYRERLRSGHVVPLDGPPAP